MINISSTSPINQGSITPPPIKFPPLPTDTKSL